MREESADDCRSDSQPNGRCVELDDAAHCRDSNSTCKSYTPNTTDIALII